MSAGSRMAFGRRTVACRIIIENGIGQNAPIKLVWLSAMAPQATEYIVFGHNTMEVSRLVRQGMNGERRTLIMTCQATGCSVGALKISAMT
jgi:hypothetical protein